VQSHNREAAYTYHSAMNTADRYGLLRGVSRLLEEEAARAESKEKLDELNSEATQALVSALEQGGDLLAKTLRRTAPRMLRDHGRIRRRFEKNLVKRWGSALDALYVVYVIALEIGEHFNQEQRPGAASENDIVFEALVGLHSRACLVTSEVHALLRTGHAAGALARWRMLHECAVFSSIIGEHGRSPGHTDLAERYLLHDLVENEKDAKDYQAHCRVLGYEPFSSDDMDQVRRALNSVVSRFGSKYRDPYGWAQPLFSGAKGVTFRDLEKLANLDHLRPYYGLANHGVHADAKGARLNCFEFRGGQMLLAGPSTGGLADPGQSTAISLMQTTASLIAYGRPEITDISDLPALTALGQLVDAACERFAIANEQLERDEAAIIESSRQ
jgi:hypothetical protein